MNRLFLLFFLAMNCNESQFLLRRPPTSTFIISYITFPSVKFFYHHINDYLSLGRVVSFLFLRVSKVKTTAWKKCEKKKIRVQTRNSEKKKWRKSTRKKSEKNFSIRHSSIAWFCRPFYMNASFVVIMYRKLLWVGEKEKKEKPEWHIIIAFSPKITL